ncbi:MAG TPA: efflux RND transporter periplasmic adaptor subunit [Thermodesulfobacteriota bacterium]
MTDPASAPRRDVAAALGLDGPSRRRSRLVRWAVRGAVVAALAIAVLAWLTWDRGEAVRYETAPVRRGNLTVTVTATGTLQPTNQVEVGIEVSGTIRSVEVDYNDRVEVGQVLARLDTTKLEAQVQQSEAALAAAQARVLQAQASVEEAKARLSRLARVRELSGGRVPSQDEMDSARANLARARADEASAKAAVAQARATLDADRTNLEKAVIRSPINGVVLTRAVEPGQTVAATFQAPVLFVLAEDLAKMELHVDVDEADVGQVRAGQEATFTVDAYPDRTFPARITRVNYGSETTDGVVTYPAVLEVDNADLTLRPGMTATATITVDQVENALLVPNAALRFAPPAAPTSERSGGGSLIGRLLPRPPRSGARRPAEPEGTAGQRRVFTLRDGRLEEIPVTIGATDGVSSQVLAGALEPGMVVVVDAVAAE